MSGKRVAARLVVEVLHPDDAGRVPGDPASVRPMWMDADGVTLTLTAMGGAVLLQQPLEFVTNVAQYTGPPGELIRFTYQPTEYPEDRPE